MGSADRHGGRGAQPTGQGDYRASYGSQEELTRSKAKHVLKCNL